MVGPGAARRRRAALTGLDRALVLVLAVLTVASGVVWWAVLHPAAAPGAAGPGAGSTPATPAAPSTSTSTPAPAPAPAPEDDLPRSDEPLPDSQIVWRHNVGQDWTMSTITAQGRRGTVVLASGEQDVAPLISHDRRTVLFVRRERPGERSSLHAVAADGSAQRLLFRDGTASCPFLRQVVWSVDGTLGIVCKLDGRQTSYALATAKTDGTVLRTLDVGLIGGPTFSPDGRRILYPKASSGSFKEGGALYVTDVDGSTEPLKVVGGRNTSPAWAPSGARVAFSRFVDDDDARIAVVPVDDASEDEPKVDELTPGDDRDVEPSWSPDGDALVFRRQVDDDHSRLVVIDDEGDDERELSHSGMVGSPSWTPR